MTRDIFRHYNVIINILPIISSFGLIRRYHLSNLKRDIPVDVKESQVYALKCLMMARS